MPDADYFDRWYANLSRSPVRDEIVRRELGLPPELRSTSVLGWDGIAEVVAALNLTSGQLLLDLACGRGGYGLEIVRRTGVRLIGVDFSAVAIEQARLQAGAHGLADQATFAVGDIVRTGLNTAEVDAVLCVDAMQFVDPLVAGLAECRRVLRPGGRLVITTWEVVDPGDERLPERLRQLDLARDLAETGFERVTVADRPGWRRVERAMWEAALAVDAGDDPALRSMQDEGRRVLASFDSLRRVLATAQAPSTA
jgi:SAM-dependent methyltransferase